MLPFRVVIRSIVLALAIFLTASSASPCQAWGGEAHRAIAIAAETLLSPEATLEVKRLLRLEKATSLQDVSTWADSIRPEQRPDKPYHSIRLPLDHSGYDPNRPYCKRRLCLVKAIDLYAGQLADRQLPDADRLVALKYLVHFVGEVHQPLHASADVGLQQVYYRRRTASLHKMWDSTFLKLRRSSPEKLASKLLEKPAGDAESERTIDLGLPYQWALESRDIARDVALKVDPNPGAVRDVSVPIVLSADYVALAQRTIDDRLRLAAIRLAMLLNQLLAK